MNLKTFGTAAVIALTLAGTTAATVQPAAAWCRFGRCGFGGYGWRGGYYRGGLRRAACGRPGRRRRGRHGGRRRGSGTAPPTAMGMATADRAAISPARRATISAPADSPASPTEPDLEARRDAGSGPASRRFRRSRLGARPSRDLVVPALDVRALRRDLHVGPAGEIDPAERGGVGYRVAGARHELVLGQLLVEFPEEAREPRLAAAHQPLALRDRLRPSPAGRGRRSPGACCETAPRRPACPPRWRASPTSRRSPCPWRRCPSTAARGASPRNSGRSPSPRRCGCRRRVRASAPSRAGT